MEKAKTNLANKRLSNKTVAIKGQKGLLKKNIGAAPHHKTQTNLNHSQTMTSAKRGSMGKGLPRSGKQSDHSLHALVEDDNDSQDSNDDKALKRRIKTIYNIGSKNVQFDYGDKRRRSNSKDSKEDFKSENFSDSQNEKPQKDGLKMNYQNDGSK